MASKLPFLVCSLLCWLNVSAQHFDWARSIGGLGLDVGRAVCTDPDGNVFVAGSFTGAAHFPDTFLTGYGSVEAFVAKFTSDGEMLWARTITGPAEDMARSIVADDDGNVHVVGHFTDTVIFSISETDTVAASSEGMQDIFIAKYSADGELLWAVTGGGLGDDTATDIDTYRWSGKLYVCGGFSKRAQFGSSAVVSNGSTDMFLLKIGDNGHVFWVQKGGGLEHDIAASLTTDELTGSIYVAGDFYDKAYFDSDTLQAIGSSDMYLARYDQAGSLEWVQTNGGTSVDVATGVGSDLNGGVYVAGYYQGTTFFQQHTASALSYNDVFLARFDMDGNCTWLRSAGSWGLDNCLGMEVAWDGSTYLTGLFEDLIIADGDSTTGNGYDIFVLNYSPSGIVRYGRSAGAASADIGMATCLGPDQSLYLTGYYYYFADFDQSTIGAADHGDCFLARMTDILGVEEEQRAAIDACLTQVGSRIDVSASCQLSGTWELISILGQQIESGNIGSEIVLSRKHAGYQLLRLRTDRGNTTFPFFNH